MIDGASRDTGTPGVRLTPQLLFGLIVIAIGILFTLDNFGIVRADDYFRFWPTALIAIGGLKLWQARHGPGALAGGIFLAVGIWLLGDQLGAFRLEFDQLWPLLLVGFGGYLVWQGLSERAPGRILAQPAGTRLSAMAILGAVSRRNNSQQFRGADLTAIMGGCELDLRGAAINGDSVIDVFALWGGIEIRIPQGWVIDSQIIPLLGGVEEKTKSIPGEVQHRLVLRGFAIMSGVEVKN
jgi:Domain of unknown function (DUF5668)